jgi:DNA-binding XRE family transcriptional regulator
MPKFFVYNEVEVTGMQAQTDNQELVVWTEKSALEEARALFSPFEAAIRTMPCPKSWHESRSEVVVFYMHGPSEEVEIEQALRNLESCKAAELLIFVPHHSSDLAFRMGKLVGRSKFQQAEWAFNMQHLRQLLRARNVLVHGHHPGATAEQGGVEMTALRRRLGLTQGEMAEALGVTTRTLQSWEKGIGTSQLKRKMRDLTELTSLMDEYVSAPREQDWLSTPMPAFQNKTPRELIASGRMRDLTLEFLRLREGQPV